MGRSNYVSSTERKINLIRHAKSQPCAECVRSGLPGIWPTESMQLDHLPGAEKNMNLSWMNNARQAAGEKPPFWKFSAAQIQDEINKCEPICANHHHVRSRARSRAKQHQQPDGQGILTEEPSPGEEWYRILIRHFPNIWDA